MVNGKKVKESNTPSLSNYLFSFCSLGFIHSFVPRKQRPYRKGALFLTDVPIIILYIFFMLFYIKKMDLDSSVFKLDKILKLSDHRGNICGVTTGYEERSFLYFKDGEFSREGRRCVKDCSKKKYGEDPAVAFLSFCLPSKTKNWKISNLHLNKLEMVILLIYKNPKVLGLSLLVNFLIFVTVVLVCLLAFSILVIVLGISLILALSGISAYLIFQPEIGSYNLPEIIVENSHAAKVFGYVVGVIALMSLVLFALAMKSLKISARLFDKALKSLVVFPVFHFLSVFFLLLKLLLILVWVFISLHYFGNFDFDSTSTSQKDKAILKEGNNYSIEFVFYHFLFFFWHFNFIGYFFYSLVSAVSVEFYATRGRNYPFSFCGVIPIIVWIVRLTYLTGTLLFASLVLGVISAAQSVLNFARRQTSDRNGFLEMVFFVIANFILCFLSFCLSWLSKNGLIYSALYNTDFVSGMIRGNFLVGKNLGALIFPYIMKGLFTTILSITVPSLTTLVGYFSFKYLLTDYINIEEGFGYYLMTIIWLISFVSSWCFLQVFDAALDAAFFYYVLNEEYSFKEGYDRIKEMERIKDEYKKESLIMNERTEEYSKLN